MLLMKRIRTYFNLYRRDDAVKRDFSEAARQELFSLVSQSKMRSGVTLQIGLGTGGMILKNGSEAWTLKIILTILMNTIKKLSTRII